ncbi:MAG: serine/threonine protein kinase [Alphaproteobacteria bacterium]|nr:serine/threonine protein kinase [Alphaproteobacteria bacterium]
MEHVTQQHRAYTILGVIGEGGFGRVYRARLKDGDFEKDVAIKMLHERSPDPMLLARFRDEAKILALLRDRAVVSVDPPVKLDDRWAVVMDFVDGLSLGQIVRRLGPLPPQVALEVVAEIARALDKAYSFPRQDGQPLRLLHRDIKPANIQITPSGEIRLLDFGTAYADFENREADTQADIAGTPGYIAPERLEGVEGPSGDIFSLGVTLWFALTGESPSQRRGDDLTSALVEHAADDQHLASALSLAIRMRDRYQAGRPTAKQVQNEARELVRGMPGPFLEEWSNQVPHRALEDDALTGQRLTETLQQTVTQPTQTGVSKTLVYGTGLGMTVFATIAAGAIGILIGLAFLYGMRSGKKVDPAVEPEPVAVDVPQQPRPPAPVPPGSTAMRFASVPDGATVTIDGTVLGKTPLDAFPLANGEHRMRMHKGLFEVKGVIFVGPDQVTTYTWDVTQGTEGMKPPLSSFGTSPVTFTSDPPGAEVWLDGTRIGLTPLAEHRLSDGSHELQLKKGVFSARRKIDVKPDGTAKYAWSVTQGEAGLHAE